jgi:hypothetical protein
MAANGDRAAHASTGRLWWIALAAIVPVGVSLLALRARRMRPLDSFESWWQIRDAARAAGVSLPVPPARDPSLFI